MNDCSFSSKKWQFWCNENLNIFYKNSRLFWVFLISGFLKNIMENMAVI